MDNVSDQVQDQTVDNAASDSTNSLEQLQEEVRSLKEQNGVLQKEMTVSRQQISEYQKQMKEIGSTPAQPSYTPNNQTANDGSGDRVKEAAKLLVEQAGLTDAAKAEEIARKVAADIANQTVDGYQKRIDITSAINAHNGNYKSKEAHISDEEKEQIIKASQATGFSVSQLIWGMKGEAMHKEMADRDSSFRGKTVNTSHTQMDIPFETNKDIKKEDIQPEKFDENFDKLWDAR